jgi:predicted RNA binding protein YcfA (HicA-like mRNA interferase family)
MRGLRSISGRELARKLGSVGFRVVRQKGSHIILRRETEPPLTVCVPDRKELKRETFKASCSTPAGRQANWMGWTRQAVG